MKRHPGTFAAGLVFLVIGAAYLLEAFEVWTVDPGRAWPVLIIAVGLVIVFTSWRRPPAQAESPVATPPAPTGDSPPS